MSEPLIYEAGDERATERLGAALAASLPQPSTVALIGPLGAGKTRLVRAIAQAAGIGEQSVASPTFVLLHEYVGPTPIYHFDAYRLRSEAEFEALGPEEYFAGPGWSLVEWADRVPGCLPAERLEIVIEPTGPRSRRFAMRGVGSQYLDVVESLRRRLDSAAQKNSRGF